MLGIRCHIGAMAGAALFASSGALAQDTPNLPCNAACGWWMSIGQPAAPAPAVPPPVVKALAPAVLPLERHDRTSSPYSSKRRVARTRLDRSTALQAASVRSMTPAPAGPASMAPLAGSTPILGTTFEWASDRHR